ncbi:helix-turn-helix domain-containing protein [Gallibacterium salpingitidis]|uniref:helix-turn-helix domain-containing protein n=1 Tax=Gallibacterium salpingitidis TaxID=505341 RepID=UPI00266F2251|nr:helix-turn-helix transcriptional regulator [Gallibacterium salpingitidis]WKS99759.1 helix-turn-helix domain-containing protein [Gallibacterium salpingitidis]
MSKPNIYDLGFSKRMEILIEEHGGSIATFAQKLDVSPPTVARWLKGQADPTRTNMIKISQATGVSLEWLATGNCADTVPSIHTEPEPTIEQALQALQRAIERQKPKDNPILDGQPLKVEEMTVIRNYRKTDDRGREAILTLSFSMLGFATNTASDNDKDEAIAKAANGS